ncbi:isocitrate lyase/phosphoenolpyruvate mutase family protein [Nonomuraea sp. NPDC050451]|uniref:isocitrate lyase/phosphoenolpyruvate mutase family protein n=1 Tax=Nonomuraea sp. NPDC050451 TaxID=3364364 RepID=UPI00379522AB
MAVEKSIAHRLRASLNDRGQTRPLRAIGAPNAIAARAAADAGCDALWVSGLEVSTAAGLPDANLVSVRDLTGVVAALDAVSDRPIIVDVDNAAGSFDGARRYARELWRSGAAALCIEDSAYPKCNSFSSGRRQGLADLTLICDQIREIRQTVGDDLVLIGRTEGLICDAGFPETLKRAECMVDAGADAVLVHSKDTTGTEALRVAAEWALDTPLVTVPTAFLHLGWAGLGAAGFRLCIYANHLTRSAAWAMRRTAIDLMSNGQISRPEELLSVNDLLRMTDPSNGADL